MTTIADLKREAAKHGCEVEEDTGYRDMRVFQVVAPDGYCWTGDVTALRVEWATGKSAAAAAHNAAELLVIAEAMECGLEEFAA